MTAEATAKGFTLLDVGMPQRLAVTGSRVLIVEVDGPIALAVFRDEPAGEPFLVRRAAKPGEITWA